MKEIEIIESPKGTFSCEIGVTVEEWQSILTNDKITTKNYRDALLAFYREPEHRATCKYLGVKYYNDSKEAQKFNAWVTMFGRAVVKHLHRFKIVEYNGKERFWHVAMDPGKDLPDGTFEWTLRKELVQAIDNLRWNSFTWIPFYMELADKLLLYKDNRKELVDLVYSLDNKFITQLKDDMGNPIKDIDPFTVIAIFNKGIKDQNRYDIVKSFKEKLKIKASLPTDFAGVPVVNNMMATFYSRKNIETDIQPLWNLYQAAIEGNRENLFSCFNVVRKQYGIKWNITMGLYWIRPYKYIALDSRSRDYLPTIGVDIFKETQIDSEHYFTLLDNVISKINNREIIEKSIPEISYNAWIDVSKTSMWLADYVFQSTESQYENFLKESIWEGKFSIGRKSDQKLLDISLQIKEGDVIILKSILTKETNHDQPFMRIKAVGRVIGPIETREVKDGESENYIYCRCNVEYLNTETFDIDDSHYASYRKTIHAVSPEDKLLIDYIHQKLSLNENITMPSKYQPYIDLLKANKNLVLTGAPGTGKTYMAKAIAKEMQAEIKFVQFHPSYDYTDFVEGLRPVCSDENNQIGFERKDGAFKDFCRQAIQNLVDSAKSVQMLEKEKSWQETFDQFIGDAIDNENVYELMYGNKFIITATNGHTLSISTQNDKTAHLLVNADEILELLINDVPLHIVKDIRNYFHHKYATQPDSYAFIITKEIRKLKAKKPAVEAKVVPRKDFVFIIDEINRGEASKIFGELFYAIDPGYRGNNEICVQTQYQNLVPTTDVFAKGFYVPDNVYILATMNDIDRSVESMDFAMRRRFTWKEITPSDTLDMLDDLGENLKSKAAERLTRLNQAIADAEGLGAAYMIGPSYFLKLKEYNGDFNLLWTLNLEPLLREYLRGYRKADSLIKTFSDAYFNEKTNDVQHFNEEVLDED